MIGRALLAFALLPGVAAFFVPWLLAWPALQEGPFNWIALVPLVLGTGLLVWCARDFYVHGKGTLAPWAPPRLLVDTGPYRVSRNPMYLAVVLILIGWAIGYASSAVLVYALVLSVAFHLRVVLHEEPWLARSHRERWTRYASRVPRWLFPSRRAVVLGWLAATVLIPLGGLVYEAYAGGIASLAFPPPGTLVDIGGRRLHLLCIGEGQPMVFFEPSGWGTSVSASRARERIASRTRVCSYDRAGTGWSDPASGDVATGDLARDLAVLQDRARLPWPFVIVASSVGGLTAEMFARQYPERVAGLIFLDAANSLTLERRRQASTWSKPAACTIGALSHFGVVRLFDPFGLAQERSDDARRGAALLYNPKPWAQICAMARALPRTLQQFADAPPLPADVPLTVLSASSADELMPPPIPRFVDVAGLRNELRTSHQQFAKQSTRGTWAEVPDSTHLIANSQPDLVAEAVLEMVEQAR